ncbi:HemN-related non-iron pseudo-SAM protein PsgB [Borrelia persica]|uniref:HemN-related non-iron pseudo-SAM protein PsgB n=1 Tax=Borrelia persica TaxID=44448 RepID=UPI00046793DE|nr:HemN-related non-iron pseudo-SAM protein PsgB [Borrelia persica]
MGFLCLRDLSIYIDLSKCFNGVFCEKILLEVSYYLEVFGFPRIKTLYIKCNDLKMYDICQLKSFLISLSNKFDFALLDEFTFELHPGDITTSVLMILDDFFVSRISLDISSFSAKLLKMMNIVGISMDRMNAIIENIRQFNFDLNIDLSISISPQNEMYLKRDLLRLISYAPEHISLSEVLIDENNRNYDSRVEDLWFYAFDFLEFHGYLNYEISNFALEGYESKHNLRYWELSPYLGLGLHSVSLLVFSKNNGLEAVIRKDDNFLLGMDSSATFENLSDLDFFIYHFITNLGTRRGLDISILKRRFVYDQKAFYKFIDYLLNLNKSVVFRNDILYLEQSERFKLDFYLRLIEAYLIDNAFKVSFKFL